MQMNNPNMQPNGMARQQPQMANYNQFVNHFRQQQQKGQIPQGWQQSTSPEERGQLAFQFYTQFRLLKTETPEQEAMRTSIQFESSVFMQSQTKDQYISNIKQKLMQMTAARQQQSQRMQGNLGNMNMPMNGMNPGQMNMMGQAGPQGPRQGTPQQFNPGFPNAQLQRPMQISPVPMQQGGSSMGMNVSTPNINQGQQAQQPNMQQQQRPTPQEGQFINQLAKKMMDTCVPDVRNKFQGEVNTWPEDKKQQLINQGIDPLFYRFRQHAEMLYRSGKLNNNKQGANQPGGQQGGPANQMQGQQANMAQRQSDPAFDFNAITNQQLGAVRLQDSGAEVVPASNNNATQMAAFGQGNQPQNAAMAQRQAAQAAFQQNLARQANASQIQVAQAQAQAQQQAQAQARAQIDQQQRAQQAALQARNQNQLLQGQIGGLNLPPGSQQSPAMPLLTRPMNPPGQQGQPTTPQQRPPQAHIPQMTPQPSQGQAEQMTTLMREAQQRSAALAQAQPLTDQMRLSMMPADLEPHAKQQLLKVPEQNFRQILANYMTQQRQQRAMQNGLLPGGPGTPGQHNMQFNQRQGMQPGMAGQMMGGPNMANMAGMANMVRPGMGLGQQTPGAINGQPQQMAQRGPMLTPQRILAAQTLLQSNPGIIANTDGRPFPPEVVGPHVRQSLPPDVKSWGQLKQWAQQNPAILSPQETQKLLMLQVIHFQNMLQRQQQMPGATPQPNNVAGMAPPAPMTPGQAQRVPQQPQNIGPIAVSDQELQIFRQKYQTTNPQMANVTDDQLRQHIMKTKMMNRQQQQQQMLAQQQQQQRNMLQQQQQRQQQQQPPQPQPPQQQQLSRPPTTQAAQATPQPKPAAKPSQPTQPAPAAAKSLKRPNEDSAEANAEQAAGNAVPQAPMVPQRPLPNLTQEQMSKLTPAQQAQVKAQLLKAQDASNAANGKASQQSRSLPSGEDLRARMNDPARNSRLNMMMAEVEKTLPPGQLTQIPPQIRASLQDSLQKHLPLIKKVDGAIRAFYASFDIESGSEAIIRQIMTARCLLFREMNMETGMLNDQITLTPDGFKLHIKTILNFVNKISQRMTQQQAQNANAQSNKQQSQSGSDPSLATPPAQLNAANLKQHTESHQRGPKAPQAPTTDRPPFPLGGGQSPSGAPKYFEEAPRLTNLVLPDKKRQRKDGGSASSTPGPRPSPHMGTGKGNSPELKRQLVPDKQMPQRPTFKCKEANCEYSIRGFDTQAELDAHISITHVKHDNPLQFALESMADFLDVDPKTGEPKVDTIASKPPAKPAAALSSQAQRAPAQAIKTEQASATAQNASTPAGQHAAAATPMARIPTQTGIKNSPSANLLKTPQAMAKVATPSTGAQAKPTPTNAAKPTVKEPAPVAVPELENQANLQPMIPTSLLDYSYEETFAALDANGPFTVLDLKDVDNTWATRSRPSSPTETPDSSSKDTPSTRQSDISENDNLQINLDIDMPDAWMMNLNGDALPLDMQLSDDLQTLGVSLPPMDSNDMALFPSLMDFEAMEKQMDGSLAELNAGIY